MPIVRNIDVTMQSEVSFDEACRAAVAEAAKTLRGIMSFRDKEAECVVEHDKVIALPCHGQDSLPSRAVTVMAGDSRGAVGIKWAGSIVQQ